MMTERVLIREPIAESGIELLRGEFDVELGFEMGEPELEERIGEFDALLIRSGTQVTASASGSCVASSAARVGTSLVSRLTILFLIAIPSRIEPNDLVVDFRSYLVAWSPHAPIIRPPRTTRPEPPRARP